MIKINKNFGNLQKNYLFVEMDKRIREYKEKNPQAKIISGDGSQLNPYVVVE